MAFNEWLERNPWMALLGISVTVGGASVGAATYFFDQHISLVEERNNSRIERLTQKHEYEVEVLERYLSSIKRGINESEQFDIRKLFVADDMPVEGVKKQEPFEEGAFYAANDPDVWTYEVSNELALARTILTPTLYSQMEMAYRMLGLEKAAQDIPIHAWKYRKSYRIADNSVMANAFGHVTVQRTSTENVEKLVLGAANASTRRNAAVSEVVKAVTQGYAEEKLTIDSQLGKSTNKEQDDIFTRLSSSVRGDIVGHYLSSFLTLLQSINVGTSDVVCTLINVQMVKNVAYISALFTLIDPKIDGRKVAKFYIKKEMVIVSSGKDLLIVTINSPTTDLRKRSDEEIAATQWLDDLRIVASL